jgi:radical SAM protein with 4Fe4S-binding SPASM domain
VDLKPFTTFAGSVDRVISSDYVQNVNYLKTNNLKPRCSFPWSSVTVLADGSVVPCCFDYDGKCVLGDLNREPLESIWNGSRYRAFRKEHTSGDLSHNPLCGNCEAPKSPKRYGDYLRLYFNDIPRPLRNKTIGSQISRWYEI